jgi:hypothetical protein
MFHRHSSRCRDALEVPLTANGPDWNQPGFVLIRALLVPLLDLSARSQ